MASATVALIALLLIASNGGELETTKIVETIAPDGRKIDPVVDKVIPPPPPLAPAEADDRIYSLLARAADDLVALRLTTPKNNNAYDKYRTVLLLDPSNTTAQRGVDQIVEKYIQLADRSVQNNDFSAARGHIERAASIQPDHPMVQRARANLARRVETESLSRAIAEQAANVTDKSTRRKLSRARKALRKEDYGKALNILRDVVRDSQR